MTPSQSLRLVLCAIFVVLMWRAYRANAERTDSARELADTLHALVELTRAQNAQLKILAAEFADDTAHDCACGPTNDTRAWP